MGIKQAHTAFMGNRGKMKVAKFAIVLLLIFSTGCSGLPLPVVTPVSTSTPTTSPASAPTSMSATPTTGTPTLLVWLPPQFDPNADTPGGKLLKERLDEFHARRPDVQVAVRIKALEGPGGLLDSLTSASAAAPSALPDVVALPRPTLEVAALKGLLHAYDDQTEAMDGADWYDYARQLARVQNSVFGLPFAGDALVMAYRPKVIGNPPGDLASILQTPGPLAFPAADPQALFTLALYQAEGGPVLDDQGRPYLEAGALEKVLNFFKEAEASQLTPISLTEYQTDDQSWEVFKNSQATMDITWASRYLNTMFDDTAAAPIPTPDGKPSTLATGWVWALASPNPERHSLGVELAQFLSESGFLAEWTAAAGYLPTRPSSLEAWKNPSLQSVFSKIVLSARLYPSSDILASLAPPLQQATIQILKKLDDPTSATRKAVDSLAIP